MKSVALTIIMLAAIASTIAGEKSAPMIVELPRPNSGIYSLAQAEARKSEILSNAPTSKLENWRNPYMGFCIHIAKDDSVTIYGHSLKALPEYREPRRRQSVADIRKAAEELPLFGNPAGILVTSDLLLKDSKTIHQVLKVLFVPSIQLFYARNSEQVGPANGSQPVRSETNRPSSAAGSRR
jgi:hypothetical protein